jgi:hypothetical protein
MSFRNAQQSRIWIGIVPAHAYTRSANSSGPVDMLDTTTLDKTAKTFIPSTNTGTFQVDGPLDTDASANGQYDALTDLKGSATNIPVTFLPLGTDGAGWLVDCIETEIGLPTGVSQTSDWTLSAQVTGNVDTNGVVLENAVTVTTDTDGTAKDNGAGTTQGAALHLHVTAFSGLTSDVIIVEQSTTGSFGGEETTLATFATVTGLTSERLVVTGTVARYLRVADDVTGTGSITRTVAVSRR